MPLPPDTLKALKEVENGRDHFFWTGNGSPKTIVADWQRSLRRLFEIAEVDGGHAHRFRDTFAVSLLEKAVPIETVSVLLGHSSVKVTEKHYRPWVKSLQRNLETAVRRAW